MAGKGADLWRDQTARGWRIETANRALLIICSASMVSSWSFHCLSDSSVNRIRQLLDCQR
jgi:ATP-dependent exoDNAse (exonuclease V) alpha subunit